MLIPALTVCTADGIPTATSIEERRQSPHTASTTSGTPGTVTDLTASSVGSASVTLSFTQVDDGTGVPANYDVRAAAGSITWWQAASVTQGSCSTPVAGTAIGTKLTCTVLGLSPSTAYSFQLVAFRDTLNHNATFGALSNKVGATTPATGVVPVSTVTLVLNASSVNVGQTTQAVATLKDSLGNVLTGRTIAWSSGSTAVATVDSTGLVTAKSAGSAVITATSEGVSGTATLTVTLVPVASVTVTLNSSSLTVGQSTQAVVTLKDASGNTLTGRTIAYSSSSTSVATVSSSGLVTAVAAGSAVITATSEGISGSAALTVQAAPATQLAVTTQPSTTAQSGVALAQQPAIQLRNASNAVVSQSGVVVTAAIASGNGGTLGGTTTATTNASGIAQFTNLSLTGSGNYTLVFTASGLTAATSTTISISASTGTVTLTGISRNAGSTAGGVVVQLTGSGFATGDAVTFGSTPATGVTLLNATTLQATVPPGSPGPVNVTVVHNGVVATLTNGFTYWPAPTTTYASTDFETGTIVSPFYADVNASGTTTVSTAQAHSGTHSVLGQITASGGIGGLSFNQSASAMIDKDFYLRWYILIPAATLTSTIHNGAIKLYLSRQMTGSGQPGWLMTGEGSEANSNNNSLSTAIDDGVILVSLGPIITPDVWHEVEVYQRRNSSTGQGTSQLWFDGKLQASATSANMGTNDGTVTYWTRIALNYGQNALSYPLQVYVDDVAIANGFIDPTP